MHTLERRLDRVSPPLSCPLLHQVLYQNILLQLLILLWTQGVLAGIHGARSLSQILLLTSQRLTVCSLLQLHLFRRFSSFHRIDSHLCSP